MADFTSDVVTFPKPNYERLDVIVDDILEFMHEKNSDDKPVKRAKRWIELVLQDIASQPLKWWFLQHYSSTVLDEAADVIDLKGDIASVSAVFAPSRLTKITLSQMVQLRQAAIDRPNAARECTHYAIENGRRLHLWPAPSASIRFALMYSRTLDVAIVPPVFESIILNGVLARYGQHFDRDALTQNQSMFEKRYEKGLIRARTEDHDISRVLDECLFATGAQSVSANSSSDTATSKLVPASVSGIGHASVIGPNYPMEVE